MTCRGWQSTHFSAHEFRESGISGASDEKIGEAVAHGMRDDEFGGRAVGKIFIYTVAEIVKILSGGRGVTRARGNRVKFEPSFNRTCFKPSRPAGAVVVVQRFCPR
jgi:hypothetical protein